MTSVTLVFPPVLNVEEGNLPPLGILSLAAVLRQAGHQTRVLDLALLTREGTLDPNRNLYFQSANLILEQNADIIGFSTQSVTLPGVLNIARELKSRRPNSFIVLGGPGVDGIGQELLAKFSSIDLVIGGEGEVPLLALANCFSGSTSGRGLPGAIWREENRVVIGPTQALIAKLERLPIPAFDLAPPPTRYSQAAGVSRIDAEVEFARGCAFKCNFCGCSSFWQHRIRRFAVQRVTDQIELLHETYGVDHFYIIHDNLSINRRVAVELASAIKELGLPITWDARCRLDRVDKELLRFLRNAGCVEILYGVESNDQMVLDAIGKKISAEDQLGPILDTIEVGILPILSFVVGHPSETRSSLEKTLQFISMISAASREIAVHIHVLSVVPGTALHDQFSDQLHLESPTSFGRAVSYTKSGLLPEDWILVKNSPGLFSAFYIVRSVQAEPLTLQAVARLFPELAAKFPASLRIISGATDLPLLTLVEGWASYLDRMELPWREVERTIVADLTLDHFAAYAMGDWNCAPKQDRDMVSTFMTMIEFESALGRCVWRNMAIDEVKAKMLPATFSLYRKTLGHKQLVPIAT